MARGKNKQSPEHRLAKARPVGWRLVLAVAGTVATLVAGGAVVLWRQPSPPAVEPFLPQTPGQQEGEDFPRGPAFSAAATVEDVKREAARIATELVKRFPTSPDALGVLALMHNNLGNSTEADRVWAKCLELAPRSTDALCGLALVARQKGQYAKAEGLLRQAIAADPEDHQAAAILADVLLARGKTEAAIGLLEPMVRDEHPPAAVLAALGQAYLQLHEYAKSRAALESAVVALPDDKNAWYGLARTYAALGQEARARDCREKFKRLAAEDLKRNASRIRGMNDLRTIRQVAAQVHLEAGKVYFKHGCPKEAQRAWRRGAALDPRDTLCRMALASLYERTGRLAKALDVCQQLRANNPQRAEYWFYSGLLNARLGRAEAARAALAKAFELDPNNPKYRQIHDAMERNP